MAEAENNDPIGLDAEDVPTLTLQAQDGEQFTVPREVASKYPQKYFSRKILIFGLGAPLKSVVRTVVPRN